MGRGKRTRQGRDQKGDREVKRWEGDGGGWSAERGLEIRRGGDGGMGVEGVRENMEGGGMTRGVERGGCSTDKEKGARGRSRRL